MWKENTLSLGKPEMGGIYSTGATGVSRDDTNERDTFALSSPAGEAQVPRRFPGVLWNENNPYRLPKLRRIPFRSQEIKSAPKPSCN